jgi:hypothetical protein
MLPSLVAFLVTAAPVPTDAPDHVLILRDTKAAQADAEVFRKEQVALLKGEAVRKAVLARADVQQLIPAEHKGDPLRWLADGLRVEAKGAGEIHIWFRSRSPSTQRAVLHAVNHAYLSECFKRDNPELEKAWQAQKLLTQHRQEAIQARIDQLQARLGQAQQGNPNAQAIIESFRGEIEAERAHGRAQLEKMDAERAGRLAGFSRQYRLQPAER